MTKILYYIPAIIFTLLYGLVSISGIAVIVPIAIIWLVLFFASGILLSRNLFWGALLGALPAIHMIYMGTRETGQIINEIPIGITILIYYIICGGVVFYKSKKKV